MDPLQVDDPEWIGRYRLIGRIGAGGMGRVYLGVTPEGSQAAVKVIRDELAGDTAFRRRFRREVAAAVSVAGMFTARVLDADPDGDPPWLATQFVEGPSLRDAVLDRGPLAEPALFALAQGLAEALGAIHAAGLVHRDLKPANVLLSPTGPRVIDFGIARATGSTQLTGTGQVVGTPEYMAPEQIDGSGEGGPAADVFALGSTLAFAATGRGPFAADQAAASLYRILHQEPDLSGLLPGAADLVRSCLVKDAARRPTAVQIAVRLRGGVEPATQAGPAPQSASAAGSSSRNRRWAVPVAAATVVALIVGITVLIAQPGRVPEEPADPTATPATTGFDPDSPQARYVDRLCRSGDLLVSLGDTATAPQPTGDPAVARRDFLAASDRTIAVVDAALVDFTALRDDAPDAAVAAGFGLVVDEFTSARTAFVDGRDEVAAVDPLTVQAYAAGVDRFTDGTRNLALAATLVQGVTLPDEYTAVTDSVPSCK